MSLIAGREPALLGFNTNRDPEQHIEHATHNSSSSISTQTAMPPRGAANKIYTNSCGCGRGLILLRSPARGRTVLDSLSRALKSESQPRQRRRNSVPIPSLFPRVHCGSCASKQNTTCAISCSSRCLRFGLWENTRQPQPSNLE